jgi:hypothetical protein
MSNFDFKSKNDDFPMDLAPTRQNSVKQYEEEKLSSMPISKTKSHTTTETSASDRFIP